MAIPRSQQLTWLVLVSMSLVASAEAAEKPRMNVTVRHTKKWHDYQKRHKLVSGQQDDELAKVGTAVKCVENLTRALPLLKMTDEQAKSCPSSFAHYEADIQVFERPDHTYGWEFGSLAAQCSYDQPWNTDGPTGLANLIFASSIDGEACGNAKSPADFAALLNKNIAPAWKSALAKRNQVLLDGQGKRRTQAEIAAQQQAEQKERDRKLAEEKRQKEKTQQELKKRLKESYTKSGNGPDPQDIAITPEKNLPPTAPPGAGDEAPGATKFGKDAT